MTLIGGRKTRNFVVSFFLKASSEPSDKQFSAKSYQAEPSTKRQFCFEIELKRTRCMKGVTNDASSRWLVD